MMSTQARRQAQDNYSAGAEVSSLAASCARRHEVTDAASPHPPLPPIRRLDRQLARIAVCHLVEMTDG